MKRILCPSIPKPGHPVTLSETESEHATRVLRLRDGDLIEALDGKGGAAQVFLRVTGGPAQIEYSGEAQASRTPIADFVLEMAILKGEAMEWVVEKSVELGVKKLTPVITDHTVVQIKQKGPEVFQQRWQKIADQALKQCGRLERLEIQLPIELETLLTTEQKTPRLWCDEAGRETVPELLEWLSRRTTSATPDSPGLTSARLLIGPEGGWSHRERDLLARSSENIFRISLGPWVLRAETAAISGITLISAFLRRSRQL
jgi:16S rRNA (uracil1498-N3)-methyltransferase